MSDVQAAQPAPASEQIGDSAIQAFRAKLRGNLILPGDPAYDTARKVYNGMHDRRPEVIARCVNAGDVMAAVNFAAERGGDVNGGDCHAAADDAFDEGASRHSLRRIFGCLEVCSVCHCLSPLLAHKDRDS